MEHVHDSAIILMTKAPFESSKAILVLLDISILYYVELSLFTNGVISSAASVCFGSFHFCLNVQYTNPLLQ